MRKSSIFGVNKMDRELVIPLELLSYRVTQPHGCEKAQIQIYFMGSKIDFEWVSLLPGLALKVFLFSFQGTRSPILTSLQKAVS